MRRLFWILLFFGAYLWIALTNNEEMVIQRGKALYRIVVHWLEDAEVDFHLDQVSRSHEKIRPRRWD